MFYYLAGGIISLLVIFATWLLLHLRTNQRVVLETIKKIQLNQISVLREECIAGFRAHFQEELDLNDLESCARLISRRLDRKETLIQAFSNENCYWYYILPVGAFLGELLRVHCDAVWQASAEGGLEMVFHSGDRIATVYPFDKVYEQITTGKPGGTYAYLKTASRVGSRLALRDNTTD